MKTNKGLEMQRREFLKIAGATAMLGWTGPSFAATGKKIVIAVENEGVASSPQVLRAVEQLRRSLAAKGAETTLVHAIDQVGSADLAIVVATPASDWAKGFTQPSSKLAAEGVYLAPGKLHGHPALWVAATDTRGFVYGLLELGERAETSTESSLGLHPTQPELEQPANEVRSILRAFVNAYEDKPWFYDKEFWSRYLDLLVASRFNRFNFSFGYGHDFPRGMTSDYFQFPYPYLFELPGYPVHIVPALEAGERERNMEMLRFIASETAARGLEFQLGIWTSAYKWTNSPNAEHSIEGLTPETHAPYCRDAIAFLLKACPEIQGLTLRVHGESGVPEGSYSFWETMFEGIKNCGRRIEIEMHAKGVNQRMIDIAVRTGMPIKLSPKFSAEHQSLGYHQADIREMEVPTPARIKAAEAKGAMSLSAGARLFTRYGYGDLYNADRKFDILYRLWPGSQRHLLWGDPATASAYGRAASFCGASGMEVWDPLTFRGRDGSQKPGSRNAYLDESLNPKTGDWEKFEYTYRVLGRHLYNPETPLEVTTRSLRKEYGASSSSVASALAHGSRVLMLVTSAHLPAAANHIYWAEVYTNIPTLPGSEPSLYRREMPSPEVFGNVSPLDPQMFYSVNEYADDLLHGTLNGKFTPIEVAQWLESFTSAAQEALAKAEATATSASSPAFRRIKEDVLIQIGLGNFFAHKMRGGVLFEIYEKTGDHHAGELAATEIEKAHTAWATMAERAKSVYQPDITYGETKHLRGHWMDRLPSIAKDAADVRAKVSAGATATGDATTALQSVTGTQRRVYIPCEHQPPQTFHPGADLKLSLALTGIPSSSQPSSIELCYRHVNHAERWKTVPMEKTGGGFTGTIPADYTQSPFPLQYYFTLRREGVTPWMYPSFNAELSNQPYFAVWRRDA